MLEVETGFRLRDWEISRAALGGRILGGLVFTAPEGENMPGCYSAVPENLVGLELSDCLCCSRQSDKEIVRVYMAETRVHLMEYCRVRQLMTDHLTTRNVERQRALKRLEVGTILQNAMGNDTYEAMVCEAAGCIQGVSC